MPIRVITPFMVLHVVGGSLKKLNQQKSGAKFKMPIKLNEKYNYYYNNNSIIKDNTRRVVMPYMMSKPEAYVYMCMLVCTLFN